MSDRTHTNFPTKGDRMKCHVSPVRVIAAAAFLALAACNDATSPEQSDTRAANDLRLLSTPYGTPALATTQASFYAVQGKPAAADIWYHARAGESDSSKFLEFRMGAGSLDRRPDGSAIAAGDSVLITLTVTDPTHFIVEFQPSGLRFAAADRPTLTISFAACGADLNYDGVVDSTDATMEQNLSVWRQEAPFQPWVKVSSTLTTDVKIVNATLDGFTGYALMW
jgi:hypothetical protein